MQESRIHLKYQHSIMGMKVLRRLTDQASLPEMLEEKVMVLIAMIIEKSSTEFLRSYYFEEIENALNYHMENRDPRWLLLYLHTLANRVEDENPYHGRQFGGYGTPLYNAYAGMSSSPTQPSMHNPAQPKASWSSLLADLDSLRQREQGTSHADGSDYSTENITKKVEKKANFPTETSSGPGNDGPDVQICDLSSTVPKIGRKITTKSQHAESSPSRDVPNQHTSTLPTSIVDNLPSNVVSVSESAGGGSALGRATRVKESGVALVGNSSGLAPVLSGLSTNAPGAPSAGFSSAGPTTTSVPKPTENIQTRLDANGLDNITRPQPVSDSKVATLQEKASSSRKAAILASIDAGASREMPVPRIPNGAVSESGMTRQKDRNEGGRQLPKENRKISERFVGAVKQIVKGDQRISGKPVTADKQPQNFHRAPEVAAMEEQPKQPKNPTPRQPSKPRLLHYEQMDKWNISEPVYVSIDIGAYKEDFSQISSVGMNTLDFSKKPRNKCRDSKEWMATSLPDTVYWRIAEALEAPHPPAYFPSRYCDDEVVRRADVKEKFKSYMQRFQGRNVILTFHGAENDLRWMRDLDMDPYSIDNVNAVGYFDTFAIAKHILNRKILKAAMEYIGHDVEPNEWHNSASDAVNINRLVANVVYGLTASSSEMTTEEFLAQSRGKVQG